MTTTSNSQTPPDMECQRMIVLLHGFAAHHWMMHPLRSYFRRAGHDTLNWGYRSWFRPIEDHARRLTRALAELDNDPDVAIIDFVTHSMGCIVARAALTMHRPRKLGRWVMLAPPNRGSHVANRLSPAVGWICKPIEQLRASDDSYVNNVPSPADIEVGVVQATRDWIVDESCTRIPQETDRYAVPTLHSTLLFRRDVAKQTLHFLKHGRFRRDMEQARVTPSSKHHSPYVGR